MGKKYLITKFKMTSKSKMAAKNHIFAENKQSLALINTKPHTDMRGINKMSHA
jgi:hypothetical protein